MYSEEKKDEEQKADGLAGLMLKARTILINGEVDQELAQKVISQLILLENESHDPIRVLVTSQGGHVDSGYAIHDMLRFVESKIVAIGVGWVASIAVPILFGAAKENRYTLSQYAILAPSAQAVAQAVKHPISASKRKKS